MYCLCNSYIVPPIKTRVACKSFFLLLHILPDLAQKQLTKQHLQICKMSSEQCQTCMQDLPADIYQRKYHLRCCKNATYILTCENGVVTMARNKDQRYVCACSECVLLKEPRSFKVYAKFKKHFESTARIWVGPPAPRVSLCVKLSCKICSADGNASPHRTRKSRILKRLCNLVLRFVTCLNLYCFAIYLQV